MSFLHHSSSRYPPSLFVCSPYLVAWLIDYFTEHNQNRTAEGKPFFKVLFFGLLLFPQLVSDHSSSSSSSLIKWVINVPILYFALTTDELDDLSWILQNLVNSQNSLILYSTHLNVLHVLTPRLVLISVRTLVPFVVFSSPQCDPCVLWGLSDHRHLLFSTRNRLCIQTTGSVISSPKTQAVPHRI